MKMIRRNRDIARRWGKRKIIEKSYQGGEE